MGGPYDGLVLTADEVFSAKDNDTREFVACPEWGFVEVEEPAPPNAATGTPPTKVRRAKGVFVRGLTLKERGVVRRKASETVADPEAPSGKRDVLDGEKLEALMVVHAAVDGDGRLIFKASDAEGLMERLGGVVNRIAKKAMEMSGMLLTEKKLEG